MKTRTMGAIAVGIACGVPLIAQAGRGDTGTRIQAGAEASQTDAPKEETHQGELERSVGIGGESTGWTLRVQTSQGRRLIEVQLTAEQAKSVKTGVPVVIRGTFETRHYVERGDVRVFVAKEVLEVAKR